MHRIKYESLNTIYFLFLFSHLVFFKVVIVTYNIEARIDLFLFFTCSRTPFWLSIDSRKQVSVLTFVLVLVNIPVA